MSYASHRPASAQRDLARRFGCAPSLIARHVAKASRLGYANDLEQERRADVSVGPIDGSLREILEARIRDPKTPARDLASLANSLTRLNKEGEAGGGVTLGMLFRRGTLILEPQPKSGPGPGRSLSLAVAPTARHQAGRG